MKFIMFCVTLDLSDNLTETRMVKNSFDLTDHAVLSYDQKKILMERKSMRFDSWLTKSMNLWSDFPVSQILHVILWFFQEMSS